jgi:hypothetical protein
MKIKMTVNYGADLCEGLKEAFGCETDDELFIAFRAVMKASLAKECADPEDLSIDFEKID